MHFFLIKQCLSGSATWNILYLSSLMNFSRNVTEKSEKFFSVPFSGSPVCIFAHCVAVLHLRCCWNAGERWHIILYVAGIYLFLGFFITNTFISVISVCFFFKMFCSLNITGEINKCFKKVEINSLLEASQSLHCMKSSFHNTKLKLKWCPMKTPLILIRGGERMFHAMKTLL